MSDFETAARPYAKAVFELAVEQGKKDKASLSYWSDVLQLAAAVADDADMRSALSSPSILATEVADLFIDVMSAVEGGPEITETVKNLIRLLAENRRLLVVPAIAHGYEVLKQEAEGVIEVKVFSARKLTAKQEKEMAANLKKRLGKEVTISAEIDQSLIAGAVIHAGDLVIDGSARGRLNKLTSVLNK